MTSSAIYDIDHRGARKHPPIRLDAEIKSYFYLERWFHEDQNAEHPRGVVPCTTRHLTPTGITFVGRAGARFNERLFVQIPDVGLVRGIVARPLGAVIQMDVEMTENERPRFASTLLYLHKLTCRHFLDPRPYPRYRPKTAHSEISAPGVRPLPCEIASISPTGAEVISEIRPQPKARLRLGQVGGEVIAHTALGFDMSFTNTQNPNLLDDLVAVVRTEEQPSDAHLLTRLEMVPG